jgi:hypothetical protein
MVERTVWPELHWASWRETAETLQRFMQVVGKIRLASTPPVNHWWNAPLYPTARGLTTSLMFHGPTAFEIELDLLAHRLEITTSDGTLGAMPLVREPVSRFYGRLMHLLRDLQLDVSIWTTPVEVQDRTPFEKDEVHASYDPGYVERFWRTLVATSRVLGQFRTRFIGKASPIHFFWGGFDLALTLFSGRRAPPRPGADLITREAYSHEVLSFGFWPGGAGVDDAAFYAYAVPEPPGFADTTLRPAEAYYHSDLHLFALPYEAVQSDADPDRRLLEFYESAYEAGVELGGWDRAALERGAGEARPPAWTPEPQRPTPFH